MRFRVDELASRSGASVDTIRFYQGKGLLPPPHREGRVAWYESHHLDRLNHIRDLKAKGFSLSSIRALLAGELSPADEALVEAMAGPLPGETAEAEEEFLTLEEVARRIGVAPPLLEAIQRENLLVPRVMDGKAVYTSADVKAAAAGMTLLQTGLPLSELLDLARMYDTSVRATAERAVDMFIKHVREPIRESAADDSVAATELVSAFREMLGATVSLVAHHFRRVLLATAQSRIEQVGAGEEIEAVRSESATRLDQTWPV